MCWGDIDKFDIAARQQPITGSGIDSGIQRLKIGASVPLVEYISKVNVLIFTTSHPV